MTIARPQFGGERHADDHRQRGRRDAVGDRADRGNRRRLHAGGTAATVTSELDALSFTPKAGSPGTSSTTNFQAERPQQRRCDGDRQHDDQRRRHRSGRGADDCGNGRGPGDDFGGGGQAVLRRDDHGPQFGGDDTLTITVTGAGGTLSGTGLTGGTGGVYTLSGTAATVTSELDALSFTAKAGSPGTSSTTNFQLSDLSSADATATVNTTTSVVDTDPAGALSLSVAQATAMETAGGSEPSGDVVTLSDTAANIEGLTPAAQIGGLKAIGVAAIAATNASAPLTSVKRSRSRPPA